MTTTIVRMETADGVLPFQVSDDGNGNLAFKFAAGSGTSDATAANQTTELARLGILTETAPTTDTASSGLNGRLQRIAQRITSLIALLPSALGASGGIKMELFASDGTSIDFSGITTVFRLLSATADTNANNVKASAGRIFKIQGVNAVASIRYLKLYNKASAPTVGTDVPVATIQIPASAAFDFNFASGLSFATGISFGIVTGSADNSTAALSSGDITCLNIFYA